MESLFIILLGLFIITFVVLYFWSIVWGYNDAINRGKNGFAVATLITFFAWPFGLLFWTIIRPEDKNNKRKTTVMIKGVSGHNKYIFDYREMPFLMKLLLILSLYSLVATFLDFIQMKPIAFEYLNTGFPKNYPVIWYLYYLLYDTATLIVFFKRSFSVLKKFIYISIGALVIPIINSVYLVINLPTEQRVIIIVTYAFTYIVGLLIFAYLWSQKKYFNKT